MARRRSELRTVCLLLVGEPAEVSRPALQSALPQQRLAEAALGIGKIVSSKLT